MWQQILDGDLYVILDQAEEYFIYHGGEEGAGTFAADFPAIVDSPDLRVNFLLAVREDALAKLDAFKGRIPGVLGQLPAPGAPRRTGRPRGDRRADLRVQPPRR